MFTALAAPPVLERKAWPIRFVTKQNRAIWSVFNDSWTRRSRCWKSNRTISRKLARNPAKNRAVSRVSRAEVTPSEARDVEATCVVTTAVRRSGTNSSAATPAPHRAVVVANGADLSRDVRTKIGLKTDPTVRLEGVQTKAGGETVEIAMDRLLVEALPIGTVVDRLQASGAGAAAL